MKSETAKHWLVVGGGMMGLAAALKLAQRGQKVTIFEAASELGGLTAAWQLGDVEWDKFYHVISMTDTRLRSLLDELHLDEEIEWVQTRTGFYADGKLHSLSSAIDFLKFPPLNLYQKFRLGSSIFWGSKIRDWRAMEGLLVEDWLKRWSGNSTYQKIWLPLIKSKVGDAYSRTAASFIWAYINRMYKARRSGLKKEMFGYVPGGYRRILNALITLLKGLGVEIECSAPVREVLRHSDGTFEVTSGETSSAKKSTYDRVVMTVPLAHVASACGQLTDDEKLRMEQTEYLGVVCTSLLLKEPLGGYYVTNILDRWVPFTGIIEMGALVRPEKIGGHYLVYLPQYLLATDPRLAEPDEAIHQRCLTTLARMYPQFRPDAVTALRTARAKYVMALPTLNFSEKRPPCVLSPSGLYLLNSARIVKGNLNVNETLELLEEELDAYVWPHHVRLLSTVSREIEHAY